MEFPRQEYWHGLPFPPPGDLPDQGIEPEAGGFFTTEPLVNPSIWYPIRDQNTLIESECGG